MQDIYIYISFNSSIYEICWSKLTLKIDYCTCNLLTITLCNAAQLFLKPFTVEVF